MARKRNEQAKPFDWQPFSEKQLKMLTWWLDPSPYKDYEMIIADGSIRSGKTVSVIDSFITWAMYSYKHENFILASKTMGALKKNVLKPLFEILTAKGIPFNYNRSENYVEVGTNTFYCYGAPNEASQDVLQGFTAAGALADEIALMPESFVEQMIGRCSIEGAKIFATCNPRSPYHWFKTGYIDKADEKKIVYLHFTMLDNPSLSEKRRKFYERMYSGVFYKRNVLGLWVLSEGVIYDMFNDDEMAVDELPPMKRYWVGIDQGFGNATVYLLMGFGEDNRIYTINEYYHSGRESGRQKSPSDYAKDLKKWLKEQTDEKGRQIKIDRVFVDPAAKGFITQCYQLGVHKIAPIHRADNDVKAGIELVASLMTIDAFRVHKRCENTLKGFSTYVWDPKAQERGEDKPLKQNDDAVDSLRYGCFSIRNIFKHILKESN